MSAGASVQSTGTIIGNCPSCGKYSFQGVYVEVAHSSRGHANYNECNACHYVQYLGTYTTKSHGSGAYGSGTCPDCAIHGCCRVSRPQPVPATGIGRIAVRVVKQNLKRSIPAATVTAMEAGNSIRPTSTGVLALVVTVVQRIMTTLRTA